MLMQPYQNGRIALNAILELCLLVGEFTFFNLLDQGQFKPQWVIALCAFHTLSHRDLHLFGEEGISHIQDGDNGKRKSPALLLGFLFGSSCWARTSDLRINSPSLYRLS